jgi:hypothetical protein
MASVTATTTTRKAYYAILFDEPGLLFQHTDGRIMFLDEATDRITTVELDMVNFLVTLGETAIANDQRLTDLANGGAAFIATHRAA